MNFVQLNLQRLFDDKLQIQPHHFLDLRDRDVVDGVACCCCCCCCSATCGEVVFAFVGVFFAGGDVALVAGDFFSSNFSSTSGCGAFFTGVFFSDVTDFFSTAGFFFSATGVATFSGAKTNSIGF